MCDVAQILWRRPLHTTQSQLCVFQVQPTNTAIVCENFNGDSFTVNLPNTVPVSLFAAPGSVCWTDANGIASCSNASLPSVRVADVQLAGGGQRMSLLNDTLQVSQSAANPLPLTFSTQSTTAIATGPLTVCQVTPFAAQSISCATSLSGWPVSSLTTNPAGFGGSSIADLRINTSTIWWANEAGSVSWFGVPGCDGTNGSFCASFSAEVSITSFTASASSRVSPGFQQVCVVTTDSTVQCWGPNATAAPGWQTLTHVIDVFSNDFGGCAVHENFLSATCWGSFSKSFQLLPQLECIECASATALVKNFSCVNCNFGFQTTLSSGSFVCSTCTGRTVRGATNTSCFSCSDGQVPNADKSACVSCLPSQFVTGTMTSCTDCGLGSQSAPGGGSCVQCSATTVRTVDMVSCSACPAGSLPFNSQTECKACPLPQFCSFTGPGVDFSSCTCQACPVGTQVSGFGCASCTGAQFRNLTMTSCSFCPEGTVPNASKDACVICTSNTVRTNPSPACFECPTRTLPNAEQTRCVSINRPFQIQGRQFLFAGIGALVILISVALHDNTLSQAQTLAGVLLGLVVVAIGIALPATVEKNA